MANGNDENIVENGGEKNTDEFDSIQLIKKEEYDSLSDEEKTKYVRYNPSLQSTAYAQWLAAQNSMIKMYNQIGPALDKLQPFTKGGVTLQPIPLKNLIDQVKTVTSVAETMGGIVSTIASTPVVNIVAEPLMNLFGLIGALGGMIYALYMNPYQFIEPYVSAFKAVDLDAVQEYFDAEVTPDIGITTAKVEKMPIPDVEIKKEVDAAVEQVKNLQPSAEEILQLTTEMKTLCETLEGIPPTLQAVSTMGCSWAFSAALDEFNLKFDQTMNPIVDPNNQAMQMANNVNTLINKLPIKYIKVSDLEKLKEIEKKSS